MFHFRLTFILSVLMVALLVSTAMAGSHKPKCSDCDDRLSECQKGCESTYTDPMQIAVCAQSDCPCEVGKDKFCRDSCDIGGPDSLCFYT